MPEIFWLFLPEGGFSGKTCWTFQNKIYTLEHVSTRDDLERVYSNIGGDGKWETEFYMKTSGFKCNTFKLPVIGIGKYNYVLISQKGRNQDRMCVANNHHQLICDW